MKLLRLSTLLWPIGFGTLFIAIWYLAIYWFEIPIFQLPAPDQIIKAGFEERETLLAGATQTTYACIIGFLISAVGGALMSLLLASAGWAYKGLYPYVLILEMTPVIVMAPIIILWFGQGINSITIITFLICFFPIVANATVGLRSTDPNLLDLFAVYKTSKWQEILYLRIPYAMPHYLTGLKIAAALTPIGALYGDTVAGMGSGAEAGLGFVVVIFSSQLKIPALYAAAFTACLIGFLFVGLVSWLNWLLLRKWHDSFIQKEGR
jgi:NitT/TauT family transport system permease protein